MKKILILVFLLLSISVQSQFWNNVSFGIAASTDHCYRKLETDFTSFHDYLDSIEVQRNGFHLGLQLMKPLNKHWCFETGILYQCHSYGTEKMKFTDPANPFLQGSFTDYNYCTTYKLINLPLNWRYYFNGTRLNFFAGTGISLAFLCSRMTTWYGYADDQLTAKNCFYTSEGNYFLNTNFNLFGGMNIFLTEQTSIELTAVAHHSALPVRYSYGIKEYLTSYGLKIAINTGL